MIEILKNKDARKLLLHRQGLGLNPARKQSKADLLSLITNLGFVQVDSIRTVDRAHHMILFARNQTYRREHLTSLLETERSLFEHWTHDASIIPTEFYPYWQHRFSRLEARYKGKWQKWHKNGFETMLDDIHDHVRRTGQVMSRHLKNKDVVANKGWWDWHPSKTALEYLWHAGKVSISSRDGFQKVYDVSERVIPKDHRLQTVSEDEMIDWACSEALSRLGVATVGELAAFWDIISPGEVKKWCEQQSNNDLIKVEVQSVNGLKPKLSVARPDILESISSLGELPKRMRIISPFDPVIRDRKRMERLFGFNYRIEVFVPAAKRTYGYYVFPLLENDKFIGRIDLKAEQKTGVLRISGLWFEPGVKASPARIKKLEAELERTRKFTGMEKTVFENGYLKEVR